MNEPTSPAAENPGAMNGQPGVSEQPGVENSAEPGNPAAQPKAGFWGVPVGQPAPNWNIANLLTVLRLVMIPVFIWLMFVSNSPARWAALAVFALASLTDKLDGSLARGRNLVTDFGKLADPIADKALVLAAFVLLALQPGLWWMWIVTVLVFVREIGITLLRLAMVKIAVMPASRGGKLKTVTQIVLILVLLVPWPALAPGAWPAIHVASVVLAVLVVGITVGTGLDYVRQAIRLTHQTSR